MKIEQIENIRPDTKDIVTVKKTGPVTEIRYMRSQAGTPIQKIDANHGVDLRTGETIEYRHKSSRIEDKASVRQSLKRLRDIINANLENPENVLWVTLTYRENMSDPKRLYNDFHAFWKRFCRYLKKEGYPTAKYILAAEPQGRGAWHLHLIPLFSSKAPYIHNSIMAKLWGHGFTTTKSLNGITDPSLYFSVYLTDIELTEAIQAGAYRDGRLAETADKSKAVIKGARLKFYPPGFNLYRCSRGIKRPEVWQMTEKQAQAEVSEWC